MEPATPRSTAAAAPSRGFYWALAGLVAIFGAVRLAASCNDLWLDEVWSIRLVGQLHSAAEILTRLQLDNNHPLNSLWLYLLGPGQPEWAYRLLACVAGTATVALAGLIGRRLYVQLHPESTPGGAATAGLLTATLVGGCYFLIHYSSEARGYAPAVGFGLLAVFALQHAAGRPVNAWAAVYGLACVLGLLAHLAAFQVLLAGAAWSAVMIFRSWKSWRERLRHLAGWHFGPVVFLGLYYLGFVRHVEIGGGPKLALGGVLGTLAAFCTGLPAQWGASVALPAFLGVTLAGLALVARRDRAWAAVFVTGIFLAPLLGLCSSRFVLLYPRYFIVSAALALIPCGYALARLWAGGRLARAAGGVVLAGFLIGNGVHAARLLRDGRGHYQEALRYIAEHTATDTITVSSDSDFRNFMMLDYYRAAVGPRHHLQYFPTNQLPENLQWIFLHRLDASAPVPPEALHDAEGHNYQLVRVFPHAPLSGWEWYLYRNLDGSILPPAGR